MPSQVRFPIPAVYHAACRLDPVDLLERHVGTPCRARAAVPTATLITLLLLLVACSGDDAASTPRPPLGAQTDVTPALDPPTGTDRPRPSTVPEPRIGQEQPADASPPSGRTVPAARLRPEKAAPGRASEAAAPSDPRPTAPDSGSPAEPARVVIPAIGVDARLVPVGLKADQSMETPQFGLAGWYREGPRPGERGPSVIVAHVDSRRGPDVFFRLRKLARGDEVKVYGQDGSVAVFVVERSEQAPKDELPAERIWNATDEPVLRLITCGGEFDRSRDSYRDNVIVYASSV